MLYTLLNYRIYMPNLYPASFIQYYQRCYSVVIKILFHYFFLSENCPALGNHNAVAFASTVLDLLLCCAKLTCLFVELSPNNAILQHLTPPMGTTQRSIQLLRGSTTRLNKPWHCTLTQKLWKNTNRPVTSMGHLRGEEFSERGPNFLNYV